MLLMSFILESGLGLNKNITRINTIIFFLSALFEDFIEGPTRLERSEAATGGVQ